MKVALKELEIKFVRRGPRLALNLRESLNARSGSSIPNAMRLWKEYEQAAKEVESRKDSLMDEVEQRLEQHRG